MNTSKFHQLCTAYSGAQDNFEKYKTACHVMAIEIVKELKAYYEVPDKQFSLYRIDSQKGFSLVHPSLIHAIRLEADHYWHFGIGITVCQTLESPREELILSHLMFRKDSDGKFFIKSGHNPKEFEIIKGDSQSYIPFLDLLFETIIESYKTQMQQFFKTKTTRKLGFKR